MTTKKQFAPIPWLWRDYNRAAAWYSGDPKRLSQQSDGDSNSFWKSKEDIKIHMPIAADLAAMSAGMIFATSPEISCDHEETKQRIDEIFQQADIYSILLQAAELASVFGGVFLKWTWNVKDKHPRLYAVPADSGLPEFIGNQVVKITFWCIAKEDKHGAVWRTEEIYTPDGHIKTALYKGTETELGEQVPITSIPETKHIKPDANSGVETMLAFYIPNILPNRNMPHVPFGRSDFEGLYGLFDALDEAYSALQREVRLTKTTTIVPAEYLRKRDALFQDNKPSEWVYANNSGVFTALDIDSDRTSAPITTINPAPHAAERITVCEDLIRRILSMAGYSPQSAGLDVNGSAESGTALNVRERKSIRTTETKKTFWWHAVNDVIRAMLRLDKKVFNSNIDPEAEFSVELPTGSQPDLAQLAEIVEQLERAEAVSIETKVSILHPEWDEDMRAEEVERIKVQNGANAQARMNSLMANINQDPEGDEE